MADCVLSNGKEITFDFNKITYREWNSMFDAKEKDAVRQEKYARVGGLALDELLDLPFVDHRIYMNAFWKRAKDPLADPKNSLSVPTSV